MPVSSIHNYFLAAPSTWCALVGCCASLPAVTRWMPSTTRCASTSPPRLTCWVPSGSAGTFAGIAVHRVQDRHPVLRKRQRG